VQEIGSELKSMREAKGYSLEDVQQATKIRIRYLEAIEAGDLSAMPGMVYARGFIKSYAEYLGVNGQELLEKHGLAADREPHPADTGLRKSSAPIASKRSTVSTSRLVPQVLALVGVLAVLTLGYVFIVNRGDNGQTQQQVNDQEKAKTQTTAGAATPATPAPAPTPAVKPVEPPKPKTVVQQVEKGQNQATFAVTGGEPLTLVLSAASNCWVQVQADGKTIDSGTIKAGDSRTWKANKSLSVLTGNSKGVTMKLNDQVVEFEPQLRGYTYAFQSK
jgi:cytoskeleton protein RodZ